MIRHVVLLTLLISLLLAACSRSATPTPTSIPPTATAPEVVEESAPEEGDVESNEAEASEGEESEASEEEVTETATPEEESEEEAISEGDTVTETVGTETEEADAAAITDTVATTVTEGITEAITETVEAGEAITETAESVALTGCLEPEGNGQLISSTAAGYCFLIPEGFERSELSDDEGFNLGIYGPESTPGHRERAFVTVTEAATQTLEASVQAVVDEVVAAMPEFTPTQSSLTLGGVPAVRIDNLPGQDANRKVYALNEGRLYELTFVPFEESRPDAMAEAEELYDVVIESFRFITPTDATSSFLPMLSWEGEIDGACYTLTINPGGGASVAVCGDDTSSSTNFDEDHMEWNAVQAHFGNIDAETPAGKIIFQGQGNAKNSLWAQALATWARFTAMEINAGRAGASARTTLAWQLTTEPEHSGLCSQLIVLAYGYAYANQIPCEGSGQATQVAAGWLSDIELDTFMGWVNNAERVESELGYLDTTGETEVTPEQITAWASAVYTRLLQ